MQEREWHKWMAPIAWGALASLALFHPVLLGKVAGGHAFQAPPFRDLSASARGAWWGEIEVNNLPFLRHAAREYGSGIVPLWNPFVGAGSPFLANQQSAALHPFTWLALIVLPWRLAFTLVAWLRFALAFGATYLLGRDLGLSRAASIVAASSYSLGGLLATFLPLPHGAVFAHVPLLIFLCRRCARDPSVRWPLLVSVTLASSVLAGHFEYLPIVWSLGVATWLLCRGLPRRRRLVPSLWSYAAGAGMSALLVLPAVEVLIQSRVFESRAALAELRKQEPRDERRARPDKQLIPIRGKGRQEATVEREKAHVEKALARAGSFFGPATLGLALAGVLMWRARIPALITVGLLVLLLPNPFSAAFGRLPVVSLMSLPRFSLFLSLAVAILAGFGADGMRSHRRLSLAVILLGAVLSLGLLRAEAGRETWVLAGRRGPLLLAGLMALVVFAAARGRRGLLTLGILLLLFERAIMLDGFWRWDRPSRIYPDRPVIRAIAEATGSDRLTRDGAILLSCASTIYGIRDSSQYDAIEVRPYGVKMGEARREQSWGLISFAPTDFSRRAAARVILLPERGPVRQKIAGEVVVEKPLGEGESVTATVRFPSGYLRALSLHLGRGRDPGCEIQIAIRRHPDGPPLWSTRLRRRWIPESGWKRVELDGPVMDGELVATVRAEACGSQGTVAVGGEAEPGEAFRPAVVIEHSDTPPLPVEASGDGLLVAVDPEALPRARLESDPRNRSAVTFIYDGSTRVELAVRAARDDRLLLADAYFRGWRAWLDGRPVTIEIDDPFRAVAVPGGTHRVSFRYEPFSFRLGLFGCALTLAWGGAGILASRPPRKERAVRMSP